MDTPEHSSCVENLEASWSTRRRSRNAELASSHSSTYGLAHNGTRFRQLTLEESLAVWAALHGHGGRECWPPGLLAQLCTPTLAHATLPDTKVRARHGTPLQTPANAMIGSDATNSASWGPRPCHLCRTSEDHLYPVLAIMAWCKIGPQAQDHSEHLKVSPMLQEHRTCRIPRLVLHKAQDRC